ncbi:hypothetical protein HPB52_012300 [Rhipicephalus sanguineus]|uniref:Uncharacterized protein n=1 Tax=Rhipicephalus sanguineus TaxID=34632 RepID=A0A9D4T9S4_RHISA|nr:hypothetical protein HPB52_012300 [Rhipicephalus sanguineus]
MARAHNTGSAIKRPLEKSEDTANDSRVEGPPAKATLARRSGLSTRPNVPIDRAAGKPPEMPQDGAGPPDGTGGVYGMLARKPGRVFCHRNSVPLLMIARKSIQSLLAFRDLPGSSKEVLSRSFNIRACLCHSLLRIFRTLMPCPAEGANPPNNRTTSSGRWLQRMKKESERAWQLA